MCCSLNRSGPKRNNAGFNIEVHLWIISSFPFSSAKKYLPSPNIFLLCLLFLQFPSLFFFSSAFKYCPSPFFSSSAKEYFSSLNIYPLFPSFLLFPSAKQYIVLLQIFSTVSFIFPPSTMQSYWKLHTRRDLEPVFRWEVGGWIHAGDLLGECWKYTCVL